jgi:alkylhydroperoxidase family enzyme
MTSDERPTRHAPRIVPLSEEEWSEEAVDAIGILPPEMLPQPGTMINSLSVLAISPGVAKADLGLSLYLRFGSTLTPRITEVLVLRTAWLRGAEYELLRHARKARREGWSEEDLARIAEGSAAEGWDPVEAALLRAVEEIHEDYSVSDATWVELAERFSDKELLDILFTIGTYTMHAVVFNSIGLEPEADLAPFPTTG